MKDSAANGRVLPAWASSSVSSNTGSRGSAQRRFRPGKNFTYSNRYTSSHVKHNKVSSNEGTQLDNRLLQNDAKRILPSSIELSESSSRPMKGVDSSQVYENSGKPYNLRRANKDVAMQNNPGSRVLPPSMKSPMGVASTQSSVQETVGDERLIYQVALRDINQPIVEASLPDGLLSVSLFRHQKIALAWMLQKENSEACSGGILADDQGLGKTISIIALIQMCKVSSSPKSEDPCFSKAEPFDLDGDNDKGTIVTKLKSSVSKRDFDNWKHAGGSLVVCPASVLRQWAQELDDKVTNEAKLEVLIYHGCNRTKDPAELAKYDVVLTTYSIVAKEVATETCDEDEDEDEYDYDDDQENKRRKQSRVSKKGKKSKKSISSNDYDGTLAKVNWFRVILDEAQTIKNSSTQVSKSCCGLKAKRRWCLSGTPMQNSLNELYSYFRFLKCEPYAKYKSFCNQIRDPISRNSSQGFMKLQAVLKAIMLRRTKDTLIGGKPIINLPQKTINITTVDFSTEERAFYLKLEAESSSRFKAYAAAGTVRQNYANILTMLLRLRQACDHPLLVKGFKSESVSQDSTKVAMRLPADKRANLLHILETLNICLLCSDPPEDAVITICGHVFCYQCVCEYIIGDDNICPSPKCITQIGGDVLFTKATLKSCISEDDDHCNLSGVDEKSLVFQTCYTSSKISATLDIIRSHCRSSDSIKAIVFSQWTRMLDLVEMALNQNCIEYRRLDGSMSLVSRDRSVKEFNTDPEVIVMLMSLKAGNLGLNMVAASHVILLDLWWNPTTEDQAVDRAHRIGQTRPVTVSRLTIKDTVEDRILALQEEKRKLVASAFGEDQTGSSAARLNADDLKYLFMGAH
uniref:helicase-like transcription factor CHR28 n=1 Tax=Erigeron canadensis TaxID=72917 RepID=UPI001CB91BAE|nr:helicase-like transcription factor CHR28 [Erigeron canadensis]